MSTTPPISRPHAILVPIDFSPGAESALDQACALATRLGATVHVVHALGAALPELPVALSEHQIASLRRDRAETLHALLAARAPGARIGQVLIRPGDAREVILAAAAELRADLIVMGTHGRRGLARLVIGSVAAAVLRRAACPVLTVRQRRAA